MSLNNIQDFITFELEYKATNRGKTKLISYDFIGKNADKCKIIYKGKEYYLALYFEKIDKNYCYDSQIKIQIKIDNRITDLSYMFHNCKELLSIRDITVLNDKNTLSKKIFHNVTNMSAMFYE